MRRRVERAIGRAIGRATPGWSATWAGLLSLVALAGVSLPRGQAPVSDRPACERAIVVDGRLACDGQLDLLTGGGCPDLGELPAGSRVDGDRCSVRADPGLMRALSLPVDVNSADADALQTLPGIGPVLARRIVRARPFPSLDALQSVSGIGPATVRRIAGRARIEPREPARESMEAMGASMGASAGEIRESSHPSTLRPNSGPHGD